jgi:hypothetical protein
MGDDQATEETEAERVFAYRLDQFRLEGFNDRQAFALIEADADWQQVKRMLDQGCTLELVVRIRG